MPGLCRWDCLPRAGVRPWEAQMCTMRPDARWKCLTLVPSSGLGRAICLLPALAYCVVSNLCATVQVVSSRRRGSTRRPALRRIQRKMPAKTAQGAAKPPAPPKSVSSIMVEELVEELEPDERVADSKIAKPIKKALL
jgi:hypothetical protein